MQKLITIYILCKYTLTKIHRLCPHTLSQFLHSPWAKPGAEGNQQNSTPSCGGNADLHQQKCRPQGVCKNAIEISGDCA